MSSVKSDDGDKASCKISNNQSTDKPVLTPRDQEVLMAAWLSIKGAEPQLDYGKLATILKLKNAHSANTTFCNVKKKVKAYHVASGGNGNAAVPSPRAKTGTTRKRAAAHDPLVTQSGMATKRTKIESAEAVEEETPIKEEQDGSV